MDSAQTSANKCHICTVFVTHQKQHPSNGYEISERYGGNNNGQNQTLIFQKGWSWSPNFVNKVRKETAMVWPCKKIGEKKDTQEGRQNYNMWGQPHGINQNKFAQPCIRRHPAKGKS